MGRLARFIHFYTDNYLGDSDDKYPVNKVFGTSPLTLANALAKKLKSLIQFGKVSVTDGVITCNNGVLSWGLLTKNLFDKDSPTMYGKYIDNSGVIKPTSSGNITTIYLQLIPVEPLTSYTVSGVSDEATYIRVCEYDNTADISLSTGFITRTLTAQAKNPSLTFTTKANTAYVVLNPDDIVSDIQLELGSEVTPYEPYQEGIITTGTAEEVTVTGANLMAKPSSIISAPPFENAFFIKAGNYYHSFEIQNATSWRIGIRTYSADGTNISDDSYKPVLNGISSSFYWNAAQLWLQGANSTSKTATLYIPKDCYVAFSFSNGDITYATTVSNVMLNVGSTPLPYVPYSSQTVSDIPNLYAVDGLTDEHDIITGKTIRRTEATVYDSSNPPTGRFIGNATDGAVIVQALETVYEDDAVATFTAEEETPLNLVKAEFAPVQDLHGQDAPYPAGGGANKCDIEAWLTSAGVPYQIDANGWAIFSFTDATLYNYHFPITLNGNGSAIILLDTARTTATNFRLRVYQDSSVVAETAGGNPQSAKTENRAFNRVGFNWSTSGTVVAKVCVVEGSTISAYSPYSNQCPIEGWTGVDIQHAGENLIDESSLATVDIIYSNGELVGTALKFHQTYGSAAKAIRIPQKGTNPVTVSFEACSEGNVSTTGNGLFTTFYYEDGTNTAQAISNSTTEYTQFSLSSTDGKKLVGLSFGYGSNGGNIWHVRKMMLNSGSTALPFVPYHGELIHINFRTDTINQWDEELEVGSISTSTGEPSGPNDRIRSKNFIPCSPSTAYYVIDPTSGNNIRLFFYDANHSFISVGNWTGNTSVTTPSNAHYIKFITAASYGTTYKNDISINYPSSETGYHPYLTTVYGGYLRINRDGSVDLVGTWTVPTYDGSDDEIWGRYTSGSASAYAMTISVSDLLYAPAEINFISNYLTPIDLNATWGNYDTFVSTNVSNRIVTGVRSITTVDAWKTYLSQNPLQIGYKLLTPVIYHLPSIDALKSYDGVNNVWHSANGKITVALADADVIEQNTPQPITLSEGTNTVSWTAEVSGKEMSVEYRTSEAPHQAQMLGVNALPNLNLNAPTLQPIGGIGDIQPAVLNPLTIEDEVVNEEPEEEPAENAEEQI